MKTDNGNKGFALIGKIVVALIIIVIALPFVFNELFHKNFNPPEQNIYLYSQKSENGLYTHKMVIQFSADNIMHFYNYDVSAFGQISGLKLDYKFAGNSYYHLFGPVHMNSSPSLFPWQNYEVWNKYILDKAKIKLKLKNMYSMNVEGISKFDSNQIQNILIQINTKSIVFDGLTFDLIGEYDTTDYEIEQIDKDGKEEQI